MTMTLGYLSVVTASVCMGGACSTGSSPAGSPDGSANSGSGGTSGTLDSSGGGGSGSGGAVDSSSGSTIPTTGVCAGNGTRVLTTSQADAFVDDFEEANGVSAGWSTFNDVTPTINSFKILQAPGGAATTAHAGHYAGTGAKTTANGGFGVGAVYNVAINPSADLYCIDIAAFTGVSFWAKAATAGSTISLNFVLPQTNQYTTTDAGVANGGDCQTNCYNHPRVTFTLTTSWAQYTAPFASAGGGTAKVESVIQELAWLSPDANWDFTLDEVAFYSGTPPTGAVGPNPIGGTGNGDQ
jgi:hypothetical protein